MIVPAEKLPEPSLNTIAEAILEAEADEYIVYAVPSSAADAVAVIPDPEIEIVDAYWPVVSVPKATAFATMVAVNVVSPEPDHITLPERSPERFNVLGVYQNPLEPDVIEYPA